MAVSHGPRFDEIGYWSEVKLDIVKDYAKAYSTILASQPNLNHVYIDGFAGPGVHLSKTSGQFVPGSPLNALIVEPAFKEYFLIDLDGDKIGSLRSLIGDRKDVRLLQGDSNAVLLRDVFPKVKYEQYRRGLCLLDPYGLQLDWKVIETAGQMGTLDVFLNFPIMDMNRNALWHNPAGVAPEDAVRMTRFWGDESWKGTAYRKEPDLFEEQTVKNDNESVVAGFRKRLKDVAKFGYVPEPIPMRNSTGAVVYYLFFASKKAVAAKIVDDIFKKYRERPR